MPAKMKKASVTKITNPAAYLFDFTGWEKMSAKEFRKLKTTAISFYRNNLKSSDLQSDVYKWLKNRKEKATVIRAVKAGDVSSTAGLLCRLMNSGCPDFNELENEYWESLSGTTGTIKPLTDYILPEIEKAKDRGQKVLKDQKKQKAATNNAPVISIQERMRIQLVPFFEQIEGFLDDWKDGKSKLKDFDPYKKMLGYEPKIKPAHAKLIAEQYTRMFSEAKEVLAFKDADIKENYGYMKPKQRKEFAKFFADLESACDMLQQKGKTTRKPRAKKAQSADKLVSKVKYCSEFKDLNLVSIHPRDIIGATELWVYNTKYRHLIHYIADPDLKELSVKGTTIQNFDENNSQSKTVRKPEEVMKGIAKLPKTKFNKLFKGLTTKPAKAKGRLNSDTILLKVFR